MPAPSFAIDSGYAFALRASVAVSLFCTATLGCVVGEDDELDIDQQGCVLNANLLVDLSKQDENGYASSFQLRHSGGAQPFSFNNWGSGSGFTTITIPNLPDNVKLSSDFRRWKPCTGLICFSKGSWARADGFEPLSASKSGQCFAVTASASNPNAMWEGGCREDDPGSFANVYETPLRLKNNDPNNPNACYEAVKAVIKQRLGGNEYELWFQSDATIKELNYNNHQELMWSRSGKLSLTTHLRAGANESIDCQGTKAQDIHKRQKLTGLFQDIKNLGKELKEIFKELEKLLWQAVVAACSI